MANTARSQEYFDVWKKQMEDGAQIWARMVKQGVPTGTGTGTGPGTGAADPLGLWRPFIDQATETWTRNMQPGSQPTGAADAAAQGKAFFDQWVATWDKLLADTMQTEAFAEAMGKHLDQWLDAQGPIKKASADATEAMLQALGVPSRNQVVGITRQLMDMDDRIEEIENHLAALRVQLDTALRARPADAQPRKPPAARRGRAGRTTAKATDKK